MPKKSNLKFRRGTATEWSNAAPVTLEKGEPGFVTDTNTLKIGDGSTVFSSLSGISGGGGGGGISDVEADTSPQLGGNLDLNSNSLTGSGSIDITGSGNFGSIHIGSEALSNNASFVGMKHDSMTGVNDYMMVSSGAGTYISAADGETVFIRGGGNASEGEIRVYDVGAGGNAVVINEAGSDRDTRIEGASDANLFKVDASTDRVGVGTNLPNTKLEVDGQITADNIIRLNNSQVATSHAGIKNLGTGPAGLSFVTQNGTASSSSLNLLPSFASNCGITMGRDFAVSTTHGFTMAFDKYSSDGDAQVVRQIAHTVTTDNSTVKELTTNNDSAAVGYNASTANSTGINVFSIPFGRTATFEIKLTGHNQTDGTSACYIFRGAARNNASSAGANTSTESMSLVGALQQESFVDSGMSSVTVSVSATSIDDRNTSYNDQYGRMSVKVIGIAGKTIHWVASFDATFSK